VSVVLDREEDGKGADPLLLWLAARVWKLVRWGLGVGRRLAKRGGWRWKTTTHDTGDAAPVTTRMPHRLSTISGRVRATACVCFYNSSALLSTAQRGAVVLSEGVTCAGGFPLRRAPA
jgi:hypothetical protein